MAKKNLTTRERLLRTAILVFAEKGLDEANLRDICAQAEVNLNAVRYHFGGKEALYIAAVEDAHRSVIGEIRDDKNSPQSREGPPADQLRRFINEMLTISMSDVRRSSPEELLLFREMATPTEATTHIARSYVQPQFDYLSSIIADLLPDGTPRIEQHLIAVSVISQCMHFRFGCRMERLVIAKSEYRKFTIPRLTEHILRVTLAAIGAYSMDHSERKKNQNDADE